MFHPQIHSKCWGEKDLEIIDESNCIVRSRVGYLYGNKDVWWEFNNPENIDDAIEKVQSYVIQFIDAHHSFEAMEQFLIAEKVTEGTYPPPIIYLAALKFERGDEAGARELIAQNENKSGPLWRDGYRDAAVRIDCVI